MLRRYVEVYLLYYAVKQSYAVVVFSVLEELAEEHRIFRTAVSDSSTHALLMRYGTLIRKM